uniref:Astacin domain-containing protein n=1 Tax=Parastrongyloides trichosuri TaxID=131310 RepID=A0A0N4ZDX6_PARTI
MRTIRNKKGMGWLSPIEYHIAVPSHTIMISKVIAFMEEKSCLMFSYNIYPFDDRPGLIFDSVQKKKPNSAHVGKEKNEIPQKIKLNNTCYKNFGCVLKYTIISLGLAPPILRSDRNEYVSVFLKNVDEKYKNQFNNSDKNRIVITYNYSYDFSSIAHPDAYYYSKNGKPTIKVLDPTYANMIGQEDYPTFQDMKVFNWHYCRLDCGVFESYCKNGGYIHTNECNYCVCPTGLTGVDCSDLKNHSSTCPNNDQEHLIDQNIIKGEFNGNISCIFRFTTDKNSKIMLTVYKLNFETPHACSESKGFQIKYQADKGRTGIILCNRKDITSKKPFAIISENNILMLLIHFNKKSDAVHFLVEKVSQNATLTTKREGTTSKRPKITTTRRLTKTSRNKVITTSKLNNKGWKKTKTSTIRASKNKATKSTQFLTSTKPKVSGKKTVSTTKKQKSTAKNNKTKQNER